MSLNTVGVASATGARASLVAEKLFEDTVLGFRPSYKESPHAALGDLIIDGLEPLPIGQTAEQAFRRLLAFAAQPR